MHKVKQPPRHTVASSDIGALSYILQVNNDLQIDTILAPHCHWANGSLHLIIINGDTGILQPLAKLFLAFQGIVYGILQLVARRILGIESAVGKFFEDGFHDGTGFFHPFLQPSLRWRFTLPQRSLNCI